MTADLHKKLHEEVEMRVRNAVNEAIIQAFGNLHVEQTMFLDYRQEVAERCAILAAHDTRVFLQELVALYARRALENKG